MKVIDIIEGRVVEVSYHPDPASLFIHTLIDCVELAQKAETLSPDETLRGHILLGLNALVTAVAEAAVRTRAREER